MGYYGFRLEKGRGRTYAEKISRVNEDRVDNRFYDEVGRFPAIEEDEAPLYLLGSDYARYDAAM